jgi:predicted SprT family Zn-dependent metalloprotease
MNVFINTCDHCDFCIFEYDCPNCKNTLKSYDLSDKQDDISFEFRCSNCKIKLIATKENNQFNVIMK